MSHAKREEVARAKRMIADPGFRYALAMHTFLNYVYRNASKEQRYALYEEAGIGKSLRDAERRTENGKVGQ